MHWNDVHARLNILTLYIRRTRTAGLSRRWLVHSIRRYWSVVGWLNFVLQWGVVPICGSAQSFYQRTLQWYYRAQKSWVIIINNYRIWRSATVLIRYHLESNEQLYILIKILNIKLSTITSSITILIWYYTAQIKGSSKVNRYQRINVVTFYWHLEIVAAVKKS